MKTNQAWLKKYQEKQFEERCAPQIRVQSNIKAGFDLDFSNLFSGILPSATSETAGADVAAGMDAASSGGGAV